MEHYIQTMIVIKGVSDVYDFVREASKVNGDVIISKGKFVVDGKSFLGIFSLDISKPVILSYPEDAVEFAKFIEKFELPLA